ncbi:unnamed protein product [Sympodiomycopsis kandeliae]
MERELFSYLGFRVHVEPEELGDFVIGLEHDRILAATEPICPAFDSVSQFQAYDAQDGITSLQSYAPMAAAMSTSPALAQASSPSAISEPSTTQVRVPRLREHSSESTGSHRTARQRRHLHHPRTSAAAFNRASIAGYPSMMSAQQRSMSLTVPVAASSSDSSLDRATQTYDGAMSTSHSSSGRPMYANDNSAASYSSSAAFSAMSSAAPRVPMQGYLSASSPSAASMACSSRGSLSSANSDPEAFQSSPYAGNSSSSHTSPETLSSSDFDSPEDSGGDEDEELVGSIDASSDAMLSSYDGYPSGIYDRERQCTLDHQGSHHGGRPPALISRPNYSMALSEHQKAAEARLQQAQRQRQRLTIPSPACHPSQWS